MSTTQLASIIITNYNYERFLREAIESALNQTYPTVEVIVVDDGSTDGSRDVIAGYGHRVIPVLKENGGMGSTYNAGFTVSRGEVILYLDADDILLSTAVEQAVKLFDDQDVVKAHWPLWIIDENGVGGQGRVPANELEEGSLKERAINEGPDCYISPPTTGNAWARKFLHEVLPMPEEEYRQHADTYLVTLATIYGSIKRIMEPQACYRIHGHNDYACETADVKNKRNLDIYEYRCIALRKHLRGMGIEAAPDAWMSGNAHYMYMRRLYEATQDIKANIPCGQTYILVDDDQWGDKWGGSEVISGLRHIPFLEKQGQYWGPPPDEATGVQELERLRQAGASYIVFAWTSFWWLDCYPGLHKYLRSNYRCKVSNERLIMFDLQS